MSRNLNKMINDVMGWDFTVEIDGKTYEMRPPTLGEMAFIGKAGSQVDPHMVDGVRAMFVGDAPNIESMEACKWFILVKEYSSYLTEYLKKNITAAQSMAAVPKVPENLMSGR